MRAAFFGLFPFHVAADDVWVRRERRVAKARTHFHHRSPLGVEQDHAGPADLFAFSVGGLERHHEEIALVIEGVLAIRKVGKGLEAESLQELEMLLSPLEGLLHRDHPVAVEHMAFGTAEGGGVSDHAGLPAGGAATRLLAPAVLNHPWDELGDRTGSTSLVVLNPGASSATARQARVSRNFRSAG